MAKFRKHPDGEWPGFPGLKVEDIPQEYWQNNKFLTLSMQENLKARIVVKFTVDEIREMMAVVEKRIGEASADNLEKAAKEAIITWMKEESE
ncbi:MAG: hypothetical protein ACFFCQ_00095 [Promethearchaeota archaeon]